MRKEPRFAEIAMLIMSAAQIYGRKVDYVEEFILNLCKSFKSLEDTQNNDGYVNRARVKRWPYKMHGHVKFTPVAQFSSNYRAFSILISLPRHVLLF